MTWTDSGHRIVVWKWTTGDAAWVQQHVVDVPSPIGLPNPPWVTGAVISGATDATFILHGVFSGDGEVNAVVIAHAHDGWGLLDRPSHSKTSLSVDSTGSGWYNAAFADGLLATADENPVYSGVDGGRYPVVTYWRSVEGRVVEDHDNVTTAVSVDAPPRGSAAQLPEVCPDSPPDGTYLTSVDAEDALRKNAVAGDKVKLSFPVIGSGQGCSATVRADLPTTLETNNGWVTAPVWVVLFELAEASDHPNLKIPLPDAAHDADSRWYVPRGLKIKSLRTLGEGGQWTLTFRHGKIVAVTY